MNAFNDGKVQRISKAAARTAYESGQEIGLCASKMYPSLDGWRLLCRVNKADVEGASDCWTFADLVNNFAFYNCTNETGSYPSFYKILEAKA